MKSALTDDKGWVSNRSRRELPVTDHGLLLYSIKHWTKQHFRFVRATIIPRILR